MEVEAVRIRNMFDVSIEARVVLTFLENLQMYDATTVGSSAL